VPSIYSERNELISRLELLELHPKRGDKSSKRLIGGCCPFQIDIFGEVFCILDAAEKRFDPGIPHGPYEKALITVLLAFLVRSLASVSKHSPKGCAVDQEPAFDMRVGYRDDEAVPSVCRWRELPLLRIYPSILCSLRLPRQQPRPEKPPLVARKPINSS
jgi:hypothetical protein